MIFLGGCLYFRWVKLGDYSLPPKNSPPVLACRLGRAVDARHWRAPPPQETARGREFRLSPPLNDQRRGPAGPLPLETSPSCSAGRKMTPTAYFVTPRGFGRFSVNVPCSCPRPAKNMVRSAQAAEIPAKGLKVTSLVSGSGAKGITGRCKGAAGL